MPKPNGAAFRRLRVAVPAAILIVGTALSGFAFVQARDAQNQKVRSELDLRASLLTGEFKNRLENAVVSVEAMADFIATQKEVDPEEFAQMAIASRGADPVASLSWAPLVHQADRAAFENEAQADPSLPRGFAISDRNTQGVLIPASRRQDYLPIRRQRRFDDRSSTAGLDLFTLTELRHSIEQARDSGGGAAAVYRRPGTDARSSTALAVVRPVYDGLPVLMSEESRRAALRGFVVGTFELNQMLDFILQRELPGRATLSLFADHPSDQTFGVPLVAWRANDPRPEASAPRLAEPEPGGMRVIRTAETLGSQWTLVFDFEAAEVSRLSSDFPWLYLALGLPLALSLAWFARREEGRRRTVEALVEERTHDLRRTSEQLRAIFESSPLAVGAADPDGRITAWNRAAEQMFGYGAEEALHGGNLLTLQSNRAGITQVVERLKGGEVVRGAVLPLQAKWGGIVDASFSAASYSDDDGQLRGIVFAVDDVTERRSAENELRRAQTLLKGIVDSSDDAIISKTLDGIVTTWNPAATRIFGYTAEEMLGRGISVLAAPGLEGDMAQLLARIRAGERVEHYETKRRRKDGAVIDISLSVSPIHGAWGEIIGASKIARDITARKAAEAAEREVTQRLLGIVATAPDGIALIDGGGTVTEFNPAAEKLFGYRAEEVIGRNVKMLMPDYYAREHDGYLLNYRRTGEAKVIGIGRDVEGKRKDGSIFPMRLAVGEIKQASGALFVGVVHDLTASKAAEADLRRNREHLAMAQRLGHMGSVEVDLRTQGAYWSDELFRLYEVDPATADPDKVKLVMEATHPDDRPALAAFTRSVDQGSVPAPIESRILLRDGTVRWILRAAQVSAEEDGIPTKMLVINQDISERKRAESTLREHFSQLRAFIEQAPTLIAMFDRAMNRLAASSLWQDAYGRDYGEFVSFEEYERLSGIPKEWQAVNRRAMAGETIRTPENKRLRPDGSVQWLSSVAQPWVDAEGKIGGIIIAEDDYTDRKVAEEKLRQSREHLALAQALGGVGSAEYDFDARTITWTDELCRIFGRNPAMGALSTEELIRTTHPDDRAKMSRLYDVTTSGVDQAPTEFRIIRPDGSVRWLYRQVQTIFHADGRPKIALISNQDITERKGAEDKLRQNQEHLARVQRVARIGSSEIDLATGETVWSDEIYHLLGREPGSMEPSVENFVSAVHPDDRDLVRRLSQRARSGEMIEPFECRVVYAGNTWRWFYGLADFVRDQNGKPVRLITTLYDITERRTAEEELRRGQEHLNRMQQASRIGSAELDLRTRSIYWSDEVYRMLGLHPGSIAPETDLFMAAVHPDDRRAILDATERGFSGQQVDPFEFRMVASDNAVRWFYRQAGFVRDAQGEPTSYIATYVDITERKAAEEEMRRSQEHLARVQSVAKISSAEIDLRTHEGYWSDEIYKMFGLPPGTVRPEPEAFFARIYSDDRPLVRDAMERGLRGERIEPFEFRVPGPDGTIRWFYRQSEFVRDSDGNPIRYIATYVDVTERKAAEERYRLTFDSAPVGIAHVDLEGRFILVNRALCTMLGYSGTELIGTNFRAILHPGDIAVSNGHARRSIGGSEDWASWESRFIRKDGRVVWTSLTTTMSGPATDPARFAICVYGDITALKEGAARRLELEEQLQQSQKMEAVGRLTGGVAHDFNNLLTVVLGNLELIREAVESDAKLVRQIDAAVMAGQRGADLTHRLLAFSRRQALEPVIVDINKRVRELVPLLRRTLGETIEIKPNLGADLWNAIIDPGQLESAILNLAVNSRDAMPDGGALEISTDSVSVDEAYAAGRTELAIGPYVRVSVSDTGDGMPPEVLERAFEPFFTTKEVGKGTGLGLSMVYGFAKQSGGHASIYSEPGRGTTVTLLLPAAESKGSEPMSHKAGPAVRGTETILVVEDDPAVRAVTVAFLEALGYRVLGAGTVAEGMTLFEANRDIALVLTDVILPGGEDGAILARRARGLRPDIRVLFMSGYTEDVVMHNGRLDPGIMLLRKPFTRSQLAEKVRAAMDARTDT